MSEVGLDVADGVSSGLASRLHYSLAGNGRRAHYNGHLDKVHLATVFPLI